MNDSAVPVLSQVYQEQIDVGQTTQEPPKKVRWESDPLVDRALEELDQLRNDWLMGEFEVGKDGRRERKPSRKKNLEPCKIETP